MAAGEVWPWAMLALGVLMAAVLVVEWGDPR